jgi:hypothetical protein
MAWAFFRARNILQAAHVLSAPFFGSWGGFSAFMASAIFPLLLLGIFFLLHSFDDHRRIKWILRRAPSEIIWPVILFLWIMAITISQGSSAKFVYFDF